MRRALLLAGLIVGGAWAVSVLLPQRCKFPLRAPEAVLRTNLHTIRDAIARYHGDKGRYPESLEAMIGKDYLRKVPIDPFTRSAKTWRLDYESHPGTIDTRGIVNVHSGASGKTLDGRPLAGL